MGYTLAQLSGYGKAVDRIERDRMANAALAARAAQADDKAFEKWISQVVGE